MSCTRPLWGYRATGGAVIIVARGDRPPRNSTTRVPMDIPCGKCIGCRMNYAREWGIRCLHEKKQWSENSYVTLTYNNEMLPPSGTLCLRDVQLFMKRLRIAKRRQALALGAKAVAPRKLRTEERVALVNAAKVRFFLGGEYGEDNKRPHYHALLFNCGFGDKLFFEYNKRGEPLFTSRELSDLWSVNGEPLGFCTIGDITFDSAVYCAKYALKKVNGDPAFEHYNVIDGDGCIIEERIPEFAVMSRRPGIGAGYADKYGSEIAAHDSVVIDGRTVKPPRYYKDRISKRFGDKVEANRRAAKRMAVLNRSDNTEARLRVKERLMVIAAEKKERKL